MPYADPARQAEYMRRWIAQRRAEWFAGKSCAWCGSTQDLELDHRTAKLKADHRIWSWSRVRREAELAKCQVLCHSCHKEKTRLAGENPNEIRKFRHGSSAMWGHHKCRCQVCRDGQAARMRDYRARIKAV